MPLLSAWPGTAEVVLIPQGRDCNRSTVMTVQSLTMQHAHDEVMSNEGSIIPDKPR